MKTLLACFFVFLVVVHAQENATLPQPPFLAPLPDDAAWTVTADLGVSREPVDPSNWQERIVETTRSGTLMRQNVTYANGETTQRWLDGTLMLWKPSGSGVAVSDISLSEEENSVVRNWLFPGVHWVGAHTYHDTLDFDKIPCHHHISGTREAWIDAHTKLPVAFREDGILYRFIFHSAPVSRLTLPGEFQAARDRAEKIAMRRKQLAKDLLP